jgi:glucose-1-phosphate cytidylyltransferase
MKAVILAGGLGTRISEESHLKPKPMIEIGGFPVLWHIMKIYDAHGIRDFVICCGYKGYLIKEYFANYFLHTSDITIDLTNNDMEIRRMSGEPWKVTLVDTGINTQTGGRLKRISDYVDSRFCLTYGDGVSDIDIKALIDIHDKNKTLATVTAVQPAARFGGLQIEGTLATKFHEKPSGDGFWVSGGFFVCETEVLNRIEGDATVFEKEPLENLARDNELSVYKHHGFWAAMDTLRDRTYLEELWAEKKAPWKVWE